MKISVWPSTSQSWADLLDVVSHVDAAGWHGVYVADHFMGDGASFGAATAPWLEATATLAALAGVTEQVRLAPLVLSATYRHPAVVANWAATVDHASDGRLTLGLGAGWQVNEHEQYGIDLPPIGDRVSRFAESCAVLDGLLRHDRSTFDGRWFQLADAVCEPKPAQARMPLLVGGKGDRMLGITARFGDEWNMWSMPDVFAERSEALDRRCEQVGRDPREIQRSTQALIVITDDLEAARRFVEQAAPRAAVAGPTSALAEAVAGWRDAGVDEVIIPDFLFGRGAQRRDTLDAIITEVAPAFRT
jgi:alkanesulfonate monooxygenase SsuD/methylene tetrahydromethanopterin reductase-like flavin-dependent oxidoreductase (luciferase family)